MRFYLNGEDLGTAFLNFTGPEIFPALSLNVRQSVRINFGQYGFQHPPDEVDGKAYHPVWDAADYTRERVIGAKLDRGDIEVGADMVRDMVTYSLALGHDRNIVNNGNISVGRYEAESGGSSSTGNSATSRISTGTGTGTGTDAAAEADQRENECRRSTSTLQAEEEREAKDLDDSDEMEEKEICNEIGEGEGTGLGIGIGGRLTEIRISGNEDIVIDLAADQRIMRRRQSADNKEEKDHDQEEKGEGEDLLDRLINVSYPRLIYFVINYTLYRQIIRNIFFVIVYNFYVPLFVSDVSLFVNILNTLFTTIF